jgi:general secretion pathway protein D
MRRSAELTLALLLGWCGWAQVVPPGFTPPATRSQPAQPQQQPQPQQSQPQQQPQQPAPGTTQAQPAKPAPPPETLPSSPTGGLMLQNASLVQVIDVLARQLKINYILDPSVKGAVTINTYGDTSRLNNRQLLDTILSINGYAMVQEGDIYRIVPMASAARLGMPMQVNEKPEAEDDRVMMNLIFLKYATVEELAKLLDQFRGEYGKLWTFPAANLLVILDTQRNMKRLMDLIALFDNDTFAGQRVRLFETKYSRPSDLAKELDAIMRQISLNEKSSPVKFLAVDRINTVIAVSPNPGVFQEVEKWIEKLDVAVTTQTGSVDNYVYRVRYGKAEMLAIAIMQLYGGSAYGYGFGMGYPGMYGYGMMGSSPGTFAPGGGVFGPAAYGLGGAYGAGMYGGGMLGGFGGGMMMPPSTYAVPSGAPFSTFGGSAASASGLTIPSAAAAPSGTAAAAGATGVQTVDQTGQYLSPQAGGQQMMRIPRVIPNPMDNTLLIQATRTEYEQIARLLRQLDVPPRQVLIDAKIYEVDLTGALSSGVSAYFQKRGGEQKISTRQLTGSLSGGAVNLSAGILVGASRELLGFVQLQETYSRARKIAAPSIIATDSIPASINVGTEVPTLTAQAVTGVQAGGTSLFANSITNRNTGVTLNILARVNSSGIVTMVINQEVSAPIAPAAGAAIQSPSFSKRSLQTQITVQDGDTIAIGGIISEDSGMSTTGIPGLHRLPVVGTLFGSRSYTRNRTELIIFLTPRVIYDTNELLDATEELKNGLRTLRRYVRD